MPLELDYIAALLELARAFTCYKDATEDYPVLVGGAAAAIYTAGQFPSGDFDIVASNDEALNAAMLANGFRREDRQGYIRRGFYHPDHPRYGFEQVSGRLFDGQSDLNRLRLVTVDRLGLVGVVLPSVEDVIADRLGQHAVVCHIDDSRLRQAKALFCLFPELDVTYLRKRIETEGGDPTVLGI